MSSAIFTAHNAFESVLTPGKSFPAGTPAFYLTCAGNVAIPAAQIEASKKETGFETGYRIVKTGTVSKRGRGGRYYEKPTFGWEQKVGRSWVRVVTWSNMVAVSEARDLGFNVPGRATTAMKGKRTVGMEHEIDREGAEEARIAEVVAEAEELIAKVNAPDTSLPMLPPASPTVADVAQAFAGW